MVYVCTYIYDIYIYMYMYIYIYIYIFRYKHICICIGWGLFGGRMPYTNKHTRTQTETRIPKTSIWIVGKQCVKKEEARQSSHDETKHLKWKPNWRPIATRTRSKQAMWIARAAHEDNRAVMCPIMDAHRRTPGFCHTTFPLSPPFVTVKCMHDVYLYDRAHKLFV